MKLAVLAVVILAACQSGGGSDDYPIGNGGSGPIVMGGGGGDGDAGAGSSDASDGGGLVPISGRVCLITDLRKLTTCRIPSTSIDSSAVGLVVSLGTSTLTLGADQADGRFTILASNDSALVWHVKSTSADRIVTSAMPYGIDHTIPVISTASYTALRASFGAGLPVDQQGSVVVRVVRDGSPAAKVGARSLLAQNNTILYDGNPDLKDDWGMVATGTSGVVWFPGVSLVPSTATVTLTPQGGTAVNTLVTVEDQTITFVTKTL